MKPTTDIVLFAGYALGAVPGFAVGAVTAIVSNIFLSQGPWTVWQMAGWGAVGVGGAVLARVLHGREPNRFVLAAVCGVAGLLFGAWMDIYQWTFAARQDLDTYIAMAGTSLPYNVAHAVGNVVFCLLLGPAFLRALAPLPAPARGALGALARADRGQRDGPGARARACRPWPQRATPAKRAETLPAAARRTRTAASAPAPKLGSSPLYTGWAGLGLGLGRPQPARREAQRRTLGGRVRAARQRLAPRHRGDRADRAARPRGGHGPAALRRDATCWPRSRSAAASDGSISGFVSYTAFGVMALRASGVSAGSATVRWLVGSQNADGGFGVARASRATRT